MQVAVIERHPGHHFPEHDMKNYQRVEDLPQALKDELPELAQQLYLAVYGTTWEKCAMGGDAGEDELARKSHEAAMRAVEEKFEKDERGRWRHAPAGAAIDRDKLKGEKPGR
jgi:cation transport regulator ChaB